MGSGLAFCFSQKSHANTLKSQSKDESDIDISYLQDKIATPPYPFIKKAGSPAM
jgi:hypothetical protein